MSFIDFARNNGVDINPSKLYASDKIQRCGTVNKPRSTNGSFFWDGRRGWVMDWSGDAMVIWYNDPNNKPWTPSEKKAWAEKRAAAADDQTVRYQRAADEAEVTFKRAEIASHSYLKNKGFEDEKGFVLNKQLLIPMRNVVTNKLQGYQAIWWNSEARKYEKKMQYGMRAKNAVLYLGDRQAPEAWLVEGFANGLTVRAALKSVGIPAAVVVCFSASNMVQVADQIKGFRYIFADNDESKTGEKAAIETGLPWTMPDKVGYDSNDMQFFDGLFSVVAKIMQLRSMYLQKTG
jgi:putative DNA primase/helicase